MIDIELNGASYRLEAGTTVRRLLEQRTGSARGSAVVIDDEVVPRSRWDDVTFADGQRVQLITATQGG